MNTKKLMLLTMIVATLPLSAYYVVFNPRGVVASTHFANSIKANKNSVVRFSAQRCGCGVRPSAQAPRPAQSLVLSSAQRFTSLAQQYPTIYWLDISLAQYPAVAQAANLQSAAETLVFYSNGNEVGRVVGNYDAAQIRALIKQYFNI